MMKSNWEKDIHDRLGNFEQDAPDGLWADISKKMSEKEKNHIPSGVPVRSHGLYRAACMAAAACVALILGYTFYGNYNNQKDDGKQTASTSSGKDVDATYPQSPRPRPTLLAEADRPNIAKTDGTGIIHQTSASIDNDTSDCKPTNNITDSDSQVSVSEKDKDNGQREPDNHLEHPHDPLLASNWETRGRTHADGASRWTVSASTTGAMGWEKTSTYMGEPIVAVGPDDTEWQDLPMLGIALFNQGKEVTTQYKHHLPVRFGLKVAYAFNERLSIESGLTYTRLSSDIKSGSENNYFTGEQRLNYVGVPVGVRCNALAFNRFSMYGTANVLLEKCVSGSVTNNYVINNSLNKSESKSVSSKPLQLSVGASVGVQFNVLDNVDIYAEPGLRYHFDDGSSIQTIYKEKPLDFDFSIGIRYTINK